MPGRTKGLVLFHGTFRTCIYRSGGRWFRKRSRFLRRTSPGAGEFPALAQAPEPELLGLVFGLFFRADSASPSTLDRVYLSWQLPRPRDIWRDSCEIGSRKRSRHSVSRIAHPPGDNPSGTVLRWSIRLGSDPEKTAFIRLLTGVKEHVTKLIIGLERTAADNIRCDPTEYSGKYHLLIITETDGCS